MLSDCSHTHCLTLKTCKKNTKQEICGKPLQCSYHRPIQVKSTHDGAVVCSIVICNKQLGVTFCAFSTALLTAMTFFFLS